MDKIILENFRCFRTYREVPLAPLTLLVGENSTGKSAFLAAIRLAWELSFTIFPNFNEEPFELGSYEQIATFLGNKTGSAPTFILGSSHFSKDPSSISPIRLQVVSTFKNKLGQPENSSKRILIGDYEIDSNLSKSGLCNLKMKTPTKTYAFNNTPSLMQTFSIPSLGMNLINLQDRIPMEEMQNLISNILKFAEATKKKPYAIAPLRTQPQRTYNPRISEIKSAGDHIPMELAKIRANESQKEWGELSKALVEFGKASGLFTNIEIKQLGRPLADPFQVRIKVGGKYMNIVDVGYGISQVLPILVESIHAQDEQILLLQQPEIHLHPRAQAELGTLFGTIAKKKKIKFVVETHSDNIINRIRLDLKDQKPGFLKPEDVLILYFERDKNEVKIYPIRLDKMGNVLGAPPSYRSFFLEEDRRFWD